MAGSKCSSSTGLPRSHYFAHYVHSNLRYQCSATACFLHKSHWCMDRSKYKSQQHIQIFRYFCGDCTHLLWELTKLQNVAQTYQPFWNRASVCKCGFDNSCKNRRIMSEMNMNFQIKRFTILACRQKYSRLRCLLHVKGLVISFYVGWSGGTFLIT